MTKIKNYLSLVKFSHTIFAMPFAIIGFVLGVFSYKKQLNSPLIPSSLFWKILNDMKMSYLILFILVIICMITARSAAMAFNRYLDRNFDALNPRTAIREIPKGIIAPSSALRFVIINCVVFITATFFINKACFMLSPIALFVVLFYSYTKRFTALCHLVLGIGLSLAPIGSYIAVTGHFALLPLLFSGCVIFWVSGFDIIYALQDEVFDKQNNLHSIPSKLGAVNALKVSRLLHFLSALCIVAAGFVGGFNWLYGVAAMVFITMLIYQQSLVKPNDLSKVNIAFMTANGIASIVFMVLVVADVLLAK